MALHNANTVRQTGFTLIELMVAVSIVAILATIAWPAYTDYVRRGQLAEVPGQLASTRVALEQYFQDNRSYVSSGTTCGVTMPSTSQYFSYSCTGSATTYTLTAAGVSSKPTSGYSYTLDQDNNKKTVTFKGATVNKSCWLMKGTEC